MLDVKEERETIIGCPTYSTLDGGILKMEAPLRKAPGGKVSQKTGKRRIRAKEAVWSPLQLGSTGAWVWPQLQEIL